MNSYMVGVFPSGSYSNFSTLIKNIDNDKQNYFDLISLKKDINGRLRAVKLV